MFSKKIISGIIACGLAATMQTSSAAAGDTASAIEAGDADQRWQMELLFEPGEQQRGLEQDKGRVFIYSDLNETVVDRAMDEQFDRIEHMMFVRVVAYNDAGEEVPDDDGCD